jgi:hypothetical protein
MRRIRSVLLTIAGFIGGFVATQLVIYIAFCIIAWRSGRSAEPIAYLFMAGEISSVFRSTSAPACWPPVFRGAIALA